jgi:hypothetical protein
VNMRTSLGECLPVLVTARFGRLAPCLALPALSSLLSAPPLPPSGLHHTMEPDCSSSASSAPPTSEWEAASLVHVCGVL